jgi:choline kinase
VRISQALVAIGGRAERIRGQGVEVPISKSFIQVCGRPLLHWNLLSLYDAGITSLVLCGDRALQLQKTEALLDQLDQLGVCFNDVKLFQDPGLGVHGLPYQVAEGEPTWLDDEFIFECGHSLMMPEHYMRIINAKMPHGIVFSLFEAHPANSRQPVSIEGGRLKLSLTARGEHLAIAHPMVVERHYATRLPYLGFDIKQIIKEYSNSGQLQYVYSEMPPEFDVLEEMQAALSAYEAYITAAACAGGQPTGMSRPSPPTPALDAVSSSRPGTPRSAAPPGRCCR